MTRKFLTSPDRGCGNEYELVPNYAALRSEDKYNTHHMVRVNNSKQTAVD
jgi:hypothetical protein